MVAVTATWAVGQSNESAVKELGVVRGFPANFSQVNIINSFFSLHVAALMTMMWKKQTNREDRQDLSQHN